MIFSARAGAGSLGAAPGREVIRGDARGYYSYLPALFIYHDLSNPAGGEALIVDTPQGPVKKCSLGAALMQLPCFLVADLWVRMHGGEHTGYEKPYQITIALGGIIALALGLLALRRVLLAFGASDGVVAAVLSIVCFGTGLPYSAAMSSAFSHVWSFMAIALFLRAVQRGIVDGRARSVIAAGFWIGVIALIRPVNVIVVLAVPMLLHGWPFTAAAGDTRPKRNTLLIAGLMGALVIALQPLAWKVQTGHWVVWSYGEEGFHWTRPEVLQVLFGPMKGLFFWWPVLLVILPGLVFLLRKSYVAGGFGVAYFGLLIYITSAWWSWYYGDGYGLRPIIDHLPLFALPMAALGMGTSLPWRRLMVATAVPLCALQLFQTWQFDQGIIHPHSMSWRKYSAIFLRTDDRWRNALGGNYEMAQYAPNGSDTIFSGSVDLLHPATPWTGGHIVNADNGDAVCSVGKEYPYSITMELDSAAIPDGRRLFVEARITRKERRPGSSAQAVVVCEIGSSTAQRYYFSFPLNDLPSPPAGETETWRYAFRNPAALPSEGMKLYVWQTGEGDFTIDNFSAKVSAAK
ncbi:MAG: hypothetical protein ABI599_09850 [Flavobacteriales bacterium]